MTLVETGQELESSYTNVVSEGDVVHIRELLEELHAGRGLTTVALMPVGWGGGRSILELRGLGKEVWEGIDAKDYIDELRDEWDAR